MSDLLQLKKCPDCGSEKVRISSGPGRKLDYRGEIGLDIPEALAYPVCDDCGAEWMDCTMIHILSDALEKQRIERRNKAKMIIGVTGLHIDPEGKRAAIGAGKDSVANRLVQKHEFTRVGLADPLKRICQEVFGFTDEQLWGPSEMRNAPDERYLSMKAGDLGSSCREGGNVPVPEKDEYLTPRFALQTLGTEWGRRCYYNIWIDYGIRVAQKLVEGGYLYDEKHGLRTAAYVATSTEYTAPIRVRPHVVFSDVRFFNEYEALRKAGAKIVRVVRWSPVLFAESVTQHSSEQQLTQLENEEFDYVIDNLGSLHDLDRHVDRMFDIFSGRILPYDEDQSDIPPGKRAPAIEKGG